MSKLEIYNKLKLKDYIKILLIILIKNNQDLSIYFLFLDMYGEMSSNKKKLNNFYLFYKKYLLLKNNYIVKKEKILYNKIKKILLTLKKLITTNHDLEELLNLELINLKKKFIFLYLPYKIDIILIFQKS